MCMEEFRMYLENQRLSPKDVASRMARISRIEVILNDTMDNAVSDDRRMYQALVTLQEYEDPHHNPMQNVLRKYYAFKNNSEFPRKNDVKHIFG